MKEILNDLNIDQFFFQNYFAFAFTTPFFQASHILSIASAPFLIPSTTFLEKPLINCCLQYSYS